MENKINLYLIYITFPDQIWAHKIVKELLDKKLIACANISSNIHSVYCAGDEMTQTNEAVAIVKTVSENYAIIKDTVEALHPYDCSCIIGWPVTEINQSYASWLQKQMSC